MRLFHPPVSADSRSAVNLFVVSLRSMGASLPSGQQLASGGLCTDQYG
jgi:hypothetical protein